MSSRKEKKRSAKKGSFFVKAVDGFSSRLYSIFANGRIGTWLSTEQSLYENSRSAGAVENTARSLKKEGSKYAEAVMENSKVMRMSGAFRAFLANLALNVYGVFFLSYGLTSLFMYYVAILLNDKNDSGISSLLTAVFIVICSIPLLTSSSSVSTSFSESRIMRRFVLSFLAIPGEKLKPGKNISGTEYMFMAAIIGLLFGVFTFFWHTSYLLMVFLVMIAYCLISANPETGVILTVAASPFLQYTAMAEVILVVLIVATAMSYVFKILRHKRNLVFSPESIAVIIFCGFILVAAAFSGGFETIMDSIISCIIIFGGFFITYNLMRGEKKLAACTKILAVSFLVLCLFGIWNVFYDGVSNEAIYSMKEYIRPIFDGQNLYIADSAQIFSVLAVLATPVIFSFAARQKSAKGVAAVIGLMVIVVTAIFIYGTYETVVAISLEFLVFWFIYSHKTLSVAIFTLLPVGIFMLVYPYLAAYFGWDSVSEIIRELMPLSADETAIHSGTVKDTLAMLLDGNLTGIGAGKHAFATAFNGYAGVVSVNAENPGMFYLQVICWSGVGGAVVFLAFLAILFKKGLGYLAVSRDKNIRLESLALFCGLATALIYGSINCLWDDPRMLYLFWACAGLLAANVREGREKEKKRLADFCSETDGVEIEIRYYK